MSDPKFTSALQHRPDRSGPGGLCIAMREISDRGMIDVRGDAASAKFRQAVKAVTGADLPTRPRTSATVGSVSILWLSTDQWLVCCDRAKTGEMTAALASALEGQHALVVDLSDARAIIRLEGELVRETLMKGSSVDYTAPDYGAGTVRRMLFAEIAAMAHFVSTDPDVVDLYVFRSYADYTWKWLLETASKGTEVKLFASQA